MIFPTYGVITDQTAAFFAILNRDRVTDAGGGRLWNVAPHREQSVAPLCRTAPQCPIEIPAQTDARTRRLRSTNRLNIPPLFRPFLRQSRKEGERERSDHAADRSPAPVRSTDRRADSGGGLVYSATAAAAAAAGRAPPR